MWKFCPGFHEKYGFWLITFFLIKVIKKFLLEIWFSDGSATFEPLVNLLAWIFPKLLQFGPFSAHLGRLPSQKDGNPPKTNFYIIFLPICQALRGEIFLIEKKFFFSLHPSRQAPDQTVKNKPVWHNPKAYTEKGFLYANACGHIFLIVVAGDCAIKFSRFFSVKRQHILFNVFSWSLLFFY